MAVNRKETPVKQQRGSGLCRFEKGQGEFKRKKKGILTIIGGVWGICPAWGLAGKTHLGVKSPEAVAFTAKNCARKGLYKDQYK